MSLSKEDMKWVEAQIKDRVAHMESSPETLKALTDLKDHIYAMMDEKVSYKHFWIIVTGICGLSISLFWYLTTQIKDIQTEQYKVGREVSTVSEKVTNIADTLEDIVSNFTFKPE